MGYREPTEVAQPSALKLRNARSEHLGNNLGSICSLFHMAVSSVPAPPAPCSVGHAVMAATVRWSLPCLCGAGGAMAWWSFYGLKTSECLHLPFHMRLCTLSTMWCSKCSEEWITRFLVGSSLVLISVMANCFADVAQPCSEGRCFLCLGLRLKHPWPDDWLMIITYFFFKKKISALSTHCFCRWGPSVSAEVFGKPLGCAVNAWVLEKPLEFPTSGTCGMGSPVLRFHRWDCPLFLLAPVPCPTHNKWGRCPLVLTIICKQCWWHCL